MAAIALANTPLPPSTARELAARKRRGQALCVVILRDCEGCSEELTAQVLGLDPRDAGRTIRRRRAEGRVLLPEGARELIKILIQRRRISRTDLFLRLRSVILAACDLDGIGEILTWLDEIADSA